MLEPANMEERRFQIDLLPAQGADFGHPQPVPIHQQNQRRITLAVAAELAGRTNQALHLRADQVLAATSISIFGFEWW